MAGRAGRRGQLVPPEEHETFLQGLEEEWVEDDDVLSSAEEPPVQKRRGNNTTPKNQERSRPSRRRRNSTTSSRCSNNAPKKQQDGCVVCGKDDDHKNLMFCDNCHGEYHIFCVGLQAVPTGEWFCHHCKPSHSSSRHHKIIDDGLDAMVCALPPQYTERFGEIVWAQGGVGFGWWPSFIYDPRLTVGGARELARKNLGKKHLVFFLECLMAPFSVLGDAKLCKWEHGLAEDYHLGKAAHAHSKARGMTFRQALHIACLEEGKPVGIRMTWNHMGGAGGGGDADVLRLDQHIPMSPVKIKAKSQGRSPKEQPNKELDVAANPPKRRRRTNKAKKEGEPLTTTPGSASSPSTYFYRVIKREQREELSEQSDDEIRDVRLGFITLESKESTFLDARSAIQEDMDPESLPGETWKFYLPSLGAVSHRQEKSLGPVASFLQKTFGSVHSIGDGSVENPFHLVIVGVNSSA